MRAVMALAERVLVLHHGAAIAEGPPDAVVREPRWSNLSRGGGRRLMPRVEHLDVSMATPRRSTTSIEIGGGTIARR
jgi:ABC-type glutathione transport system ATPase component